MRAILLIDHGSVRSEANHMLECMSNLVQSVAGDAAIVGYAHMELASPTIEDGFDACVARGATEIVAFPYMLSPGKHSTGDIPRMVAAAAARHPDVSYRVTAAFGVHEKLADVVLERAGLEPARVLSAGDACRCWDSANTERQCGDACRATTC
jgi:sirohydrochlorin ferrochelatase